MSSAVAIPLDAAVESIWAEQDVSSRTNTVKLLYKILLNVLENPTEAKYRKINAEKLAPKLTSFGLGPIYVLRHAGFVKTETHFEMPLDASLDPLQVALSTVQSFRLLRDGDAAAAADAADAAKSEQARKVAAEQEAAREAAEMAAYQERQRLRKLEREAALKAQAEQSEKNKAYRLAKERREARKQAIQARARALDRKRAEEARAAAIAAGELDPDTLAAPIKVNASRYALICEETGEGFMTAEEAAKYAEETGHQNFRQVPQEEPDLDEELANILEQAQKDKTKSATGKKIQDMTSDEKMEWLAKRREEVREKHRKEKIEREKNSEASRRTMAKAAADMKERREMFAAKDLARLKKKEEAERKKHRKEIKEKIRLQKERRKREAEREKERLAKLKAEQEK